MIESRSKIVTDELSRAVMPTPAPVTNTSPDDLACSEVKSYKSKTNSVDFDPEQQIIMILPSARS
jgi:hypothetical protein